MAEIIVSDFRTATVSLGAGDFLSFKPSGSIFVTTGAGVIGARENGLTVGGDLIATAGDGIQLFGEQGINNVSVLSTGLVLGNFSGIIAAGRTNIDNAGEIIGLQGGGLSLGGSGIQLSNSGLISGKVFALDISGAGGGSQITNFGVMQAATGRGMNIILDNNYILNFGRIDGGLDGMAFAGGDAGSSDTIVNWGTIIGRSQEGIEGDGSDEVVTNRGTIQGVTAALDLKGGNDFFDNSLGGVVFGTILMGAGNDTVVAGQGAETINGGSESDTVSYANSPRKMLINLTGQVTTDAIGVQDTLTSVENAIGSAFDDSLYGDSNGNNLDGGSDGSDLIFGGGGIDTVSYASSTRSVLINLVGQITSDGPNTDTLSSIENAIGSQFSDRIIASSEPNLLEGLGGNDSFVFRRGMAHGDEIVDFSGNGAGAGDSLEFVGYGPGATFVQLDAFNWQVNSGDGLVHEVITLQNGATVHPSDVLFL
jgi:hypothetical protein